MACREGDFDIESLSDAQSVGSSTSVISDPSSVTVISEDKHTVIFDGELIFIDSTDWRHSRRLVVQLFTSLCAFVMFGMSDQAIGALIPRLQSYYHLTDLSTSMIFLFQVLGYFSLAILNDSLHTRLGLGGVVWMGCICTTLCFLVVSFHPPYAVFLASFMFNGLGIGALDAALNAWIGNLKDANQLLGILHGMYGVGCMLSPPIISRLVERETDPWNWNLYFLIMTLYGTFILILAIFCFRSETPKKFKYMIKTNNETHLAETQEVQEGQDIELEDANKNVTATSEECENALHLDLDRGHSVPVSLVLRNTSVWMLSTILFLYVGGELAFGGWLITFLTRINKLSHETSSFMATSFWTGLTLGRLFLGFATAHFFKNELTANLTYMVCSTAGFMVFYAFAFSNIVSLLFIITLVTGIFVGPIFPTTIVASIKILPRKLHTTGVGLICAFGGGGAAGVPLLVGLVALASDWGLAVLPLIVSAIFLILTLMWLVLFYKHRSTYAATRL